MRCSTCACRCPISPPARARGRISWRTSPSASRRRTSARAPRRRASADPMRRTPTSHMRYRAAFLALCMAVLPAAAEPGTAAAGYPLTPTRGGRLLVTVRVNQVPVEALLDSAAEMSFIDPALARRLKLSAAAAVAAQGSGAQAVAAGLVSGVRLEAFGLTLSDQTMAITDLADVGARLLHRRIDMILGREVFDAARLQIDIAHHRLRVVSGTGEPRGIRLPLTTQRGIETFGVRLEGGDPVQAALDLGNGSQVLVGAGLAARL